MRLKTKILWTGLAALLLLFFVNFPKIKHHLQILRLGEMYYRVEQVTENLPQVDKVEINLLEDAAKDPSEASPDGYAKQSGPNLFPVYGYGRFDRILSTSVVTGSDAEQIAELWRTLHFSRGFSALCHYPAYGLRFYHGSTLLFETSVCWKCSNFSIKSFGFWGFDTESHTATNLLIQLEKHVPLPSKISSNPGAHPQFENGE